MKPQGNRFPREEAVLEQTGPPAIVGPRFAIVGSRVFKNPKALERASDIILEYLSVYRVSAIVSGGAPGIDTLAADIAIMHALPLVILVPENQRWSPRGYKARNRLIVDECDMLLCLRCAWAESYGSGWTADLAEKCGKPTFRYLL